MIAIPACLASHDPAAVNCRDGAVARQERCLPLLNRQFMLLAVYMPEHDPQPGHTFCSILEESVIVYDTGLSGADSFEHL